MVLVFYNPNSAIANGTNPFSSGWNPCHCTSRLNAVMAKLRWSYRFPNLLHALYFWMEAQRRQREE